ncbi:alpha/beta hydrolase family protein [Myroides sp. LJL119]
MQLIKHNHLLETLPLPILCDSTYLKGNKNMPLVIFAHGYKGFKDWGAWHLAMDQIAMAGAYVVKFNFSHNGTTPEQASDFTDLQAFAKNTYSQEQIDFECVIDFFSKNPLVDSSNITIIGHSRAGGAVILQAYYNQLVTKVVSWAGVCDFKKRFPQRYRFQRWQKEGVFYVTNSRTNQKLPHYFSYWQDFEQNQDKLDIQKAAQNLKKPALVIHGTLDTAVELKEAQLLHLWISNSELYIVEDADHVFGARHPFTQSTLPDHLKLVTDKTIDFIFNS